MSRIRIAVLSSGGGTTFQNLVERSRDGRLDADVVALVASRPDCGAVAKAPSAGVPCVVVPWTKDQATFDAAITGAVEAARVDLVCLGGFLRLWTIPDRFAGRVMNIHPALLPAFGGKGMHGARVHEAVVAAGVKVTGCTVHFATNAYDAGPIIVQRTVPVAFEDTPDDVARRVFEQECEAYPEAIRLFAGGRLTIAEGRVRVS
jgi:phosphoribosylglycinamide formyltransferase 1